MDYSFFDALIDVVFIVNNEKGIVYCNEAAASLCESSVRRLTKGKPISEYIQFSEDNLFSDQVFPMTEMNFKLIKKDKDGKVQMSVQPFTGENSEPCWILVARDVTLEEVLHAKYHKQLEEKQVVIDQLKEAQTQLEAYSKNLEQMVEERTLEVKKANIMLNAIMDSLGQGFLVFDNTGHCGDFFTKACIDTLEKEPANKEISDVLSLSSNDKETFKMWMEAVFTQSLSFDSMKSLAPDSYEHTQGRNIKLDYFPIYTDKEEISNLVLVATDWTAEFEANEALEKERQFAKMMIKLVSNKQQFEKFLVACEDVVNELKTEITQTNDLDVERAFRYLHTLEGEAATYSVGNIWQSTREPQELLEPYKKGEKTDFSEIRSEFTESLDKITKQKEMFFSENSQLVKSLGIGKPPVLEISIDKIHSIQSYMKSQKLPKNIIDWVEFSLMSQPIRSLFGHYVEVVSSIGEKLNKKLLPLKMNNMDIQVNPEIFQRLAGTFIHAFRNAIDHGIEESADREMLGKPQEGELVFGAEEFKKDGSDWLRFTLTDDGQGIHPEKIRNKLIENGKEEEIKNLSDHDIIQFVFNSGLSTREEVGELSGRGIGMNAIKDEAERMGGTAVVESTPPNGTRLTVEVPVKPNVQYINKVA